MLKILLYPFALLYGLVLSFRHFLFNVGFLRSKSFDVPVIGVGNLALGGTGKTPHTEYLVNLLKDEYRVAILSRGYLRKSKGFVLANGKSTITDIGDEPMQYRQNFGDKIIIAVDKNRSRGVRILLKMQNAPKAIILDDTLQHRYIKPGILLLLTDYRHLYMDDYLLPSGRLRDLKASAKRADIIIITKTEKVLSPIVKKIILEKIKPAPHQKVYFSYIEYDAPTLFPDMKKTKFKALYNVIILFTGIANSYLLKDHLRYHCRELITLEFPDHHYYTKKDILLIKKVWEEQFQSKKLIVTTEKDAMRLINSPYLRLLKDIPIVYLSIQVKFHGQDENNFNRQILKYVRENQRNSSISAIKNKR